MRNYEVDVPVRVMLWTRPEYLVQQFEVLKRAAPSILFLMSDGGRTDAEQAKIRESRAIFDQIDWNCTVYKLYFDENQGMYHMMQHTREFVWNKVDRCIILEDDHVPAVSFFRFCAELLEKYKDDQRIEMICGNNVFGTYPEAEPSDYFFTENGWSISGVACWKRTVDDYTYPFPYIGNEYIKRCLYDNLTPFWKKKAVGYCAGKLVDCHIPGGEYFHAANSALFHRMSIVPTKNLIRNIGLQGTHCHIGKHDEIPKYLNVETYELPIQIRHPQYVIDDKHYSRMYEKLLGHDIQNYPRTLIRITRKCIKVVVQGRLGSVLKRELGKEIEK